MNNVPTQRAGLAVRASDSEREQTVALLQRSFADGRLTQAELEERVGAAYAARTRTQLRDLTADLPDAEQRPPRSGMVLDLRLLIILLCVCPLAGLAYWLLSLRETALLRAWLMNARPWLRLLASAILAGAGWIIVRRSRRGH
jgi:cytochrome bd-type quinol oxidase subunit 1